MPGTRTSVSQLLLLHRDMLAARAAALEEKVEEGRAERGQVASLRQLAAEAEAARARVEDEVLATARIATGLEARLRMARAEADAAQRDTLAANERCSQVNAAALTSVASCMPAGLRPFPRKKAPSPTGLKARLRMTSAEADTAQRNTFAANERCSQVKAGHTARLSITKLPPRSGNALGSCWSNGCYCIHVELQYNLFRC